jgi:hypothetical protein
MKRNFDIKNFPIRRGSDQTCQSRVNDSTRDWQWLGLDGITQDNGHGLADGMPTLGILHGGSRRLATANRILFASVGWIA